MKKSMLIVPVLLLAWAAQATAQTGAATPETIVRNCFVCHGPEGVNPGPIPRLNGLAQDYIELSLLQFKTDKRPGTIMNRIAKGFTDDQIRGIARQMAAYPKK
jgi:sulfide dehydrogenase cytochrome subunit